MSMEKRTFTKEEKLHLLKEASEHGATIISKKAGELIYAGVGVSDLILHHVKIDF